VPEQPNLKEYRGKIQILSTRIFSARNLKLCNSLSGTF